MGQGSQAAQRGPRPRGSLRGQQRLGPRSPLGCGAAAAAPLLLLLAGPCQCQRLEPGEVCEAADNQRKVEPLGTPLQGTAGLPGLSKRTNACLI